MSVDIQAGIRSALGPQAALVGGGAIGAAAASVAARLGPFPIGNPAAMRAAAQRLRAIANEARQQGDRLTSAISRCGSWEGPARQRMEAELRRERQLVHDQAAQLDQAAQGLLTQASSVEQRQHQWNSQLPRMRDDVVRQLLSAAGRVR